MIHTAPDRRILSAFGAMLLGLACFVSTAAPSVAFAYKEPNALTGGGCLGCHHMNAQSQMVDPPSGGVCVDCHGGPWEGGKLMAEGFTPSNSTGPHGGYLTTTRKCATCHTVHNAPAAGITLLPASSVYATCFTCHDGTAAGGSGVYGTLQARGVVPAGSGGRYPGHRYETTAVIPGGDPGTGGASTGNFEGAGDRLTCSDCHSPHGARCVTSFIGERRRIRGTVDTSMIDLSSNRLLRQQPTGAALAVTEYGSDWCLTCHKGRDSGGAVHNHPVESASTHPNANTRFIYRRLAVLDSAAPTFGTVIGELGGADSPSVPHDAATAGVVANPTGNRGYLMPWPRTTGANGQAGHLPICQQCHEDTRDVGDLAANGSAQAVPFSVAYADGVTWNGSAWVSSVASNPRFQNFPHETENVNMLVETADDLCANCHTALALP